MAAHTFRHSTCKAETGKQLLRLRTDWSTEWVTQQPELYRVNPSQKQNEEWTREKNRKKRNTETFACVLITYVCIPILKIGGSYSTMI